MGGREYLKTITTLYTDTRTEMEGREVHWVVKEMLPNKGSFQILYKNRTVYQDWFNGTKGYEIVNGKERKVDLAVFKDKLHKRNIINEFDYLDTSIWKMELLGYAVIENDSCYKIKGTLINGLVEYFYYSKSKYYLCKTEKVLNVEKKRFKNCFYSKYKFYDKLYYPSELRLGNDNDYQMAYIEELLMNELVSEKDF